MSAKTTTDDSSNDVFGIDSSEMEARLKMVRSFVAQPVPERDPGPGLVGDCLYVGNKYHAGNVELLTSLGVTGVLNCAPSGIRHLPINAYEQHGIEYAFTNVAQDAHSYPILHDRVGACSEHLDVAKAFYDKVRASGGKAFFFCVAGQNRSATLAVAVQVMGGVSLSQVLSTCSKVNLEEREKARPRRPS